MSGKVHGRMFNPCIQSVCDKMAILCLHEYSFREIIHLIQEKVCVFDFSNAQP